MALPTRHPICRPAALARLSLGVAAVISLAACGRVPPQRPSYVAPSHFAEAASWRHHPLTATGPSPSPALQPTAARTTSKPAAPAAPVQAKRPPPSAKAPAPQPASAKPAAPKQPPAAPKLPPAASKLPPAAPKPAAPTPPTPPAKPGDKGDKPTSAPLPYRAPLPAFRADAAASRYADLSPHQCRKQVRQRKLPVMRVKGNPSGIANAFRVTGPFHGVTFVTGRAPSPYGMLDCRLALVMDDMAKLLAPFGVNQIHIGSMYRRGAKIGGRNKRSQHSYGLAMDIISIRSKEGLLRIERDYHAAIGDTSCGPQATMTKPNKASIALRNVVCSVARAQLFHHMLTPCANHAHRDHLHFDIKRGARYQSVR